MKKPLLFAVVLLALAAAIFVVFWPKQAGSDPSPTPPGDGGASSTGGTPRPAAATGSGGAAPKGRSDPSRPGPPVPEHLQDPRALAPAPLTLNFDAPPFERQKNGTVFKTDVVARIKELNKVDQEPEEDVQILEAVIGSYRTIFQENPVAGENREVVEALTGKNIYKLVLVDPSHPAINADRELVDRWGTPYSFHPISRSHMEISSAGQDRQFGTGDDVMVDEPTVIGDRGPES